MMRKAPSGQMSLDFTSVEIVKNCWGEKWHIQRSDGLCLPDVPAFFERGLDALEYAEENGIKISKISYPKNTIGSCL